MKEERVNSIVKIHMSLMVILGIASIAEVVMICNLAHTLAPNAVSKSSVYFMATASIFHVLAMCSGFLYLSKGYGKAQAGYYKAFILFVALSLAISMLSNLLSIFSGTEAMSTNTASIIRFVLVLTMFILLMVLAFAKDLGKQKTWTIYYALLAISIVFLCLSIIGLSSAPAVVRLIFQLTRLLSIATIGIAIYSKYADKDARGTF